MTENTFKKLTIDDLFGLMIQSTKELIDLIHAENAKKDEVLLLQRIIVQRQVEYTSGPSLL